VRDHISHLYKTMGNIIVLYTSFFKFFKRRWEGDYELNGSKHSHKKMYNCLLADYHLHLTWPLVLPLDLSYTLSIHLLLF
jgi:hypothetical protein